jgi:ketosteroid isomerase-like protein
MAFFAEWIDAYAEWDQEVEGVMDAGGNQVVELTLQRGRLRESDSWVEWRYGIVYRVEDGLIRRGTLYGTPEEALEAAGLSK